MGARLSNSGETSKKLNTPRAVVEDDKTRKLLVYLSKFSLKCRGINESANE